MNYIYFVSPVMTPVEYQTPPPVLYYPVTGVNYRFPIPIMYADPPTAVL